MGAISGLRQRRYNLLRIAGRYARRADLDINNLRTRNAFQRLRYAPDTSSAVHSIYIEFDFAHINYLIRLSPVEV